MAVPTTCRGVEALAVVIVVALAMAVRLLRIKDTRINRELVEDLASFVGETRTGGRSIRLLPRVSQQTYRLSELRNWPWPRDTISDITNRPGSFPGWPPQPVHGRMEADHFRPNLLASPARCENPTQMHSSSTLCKRRGINQQDLRPGDRLHDPGDADPERHSVGRQEDPGLYQQSFHSSKTGAGQGIRQKVYSEPESEYQIISAFL